MHFTRSAQTGFFHHGDYNGEVFAEFEGQEVRADFTVYLAALGQMADERGLVQIAGQREDGTAFKLGIPLADIHDLVGARISSEMISELEQLDGAEIFARYGAQRIAAWKR